MNKKIYTNKSLVKNLKEYSTFSEILQFTSERVPKKISSHISLILNKVEVAYKHPLVLLTMCKIIFLMLC